MPEKGQEEVDRLLVLVRDAVNAAAQAMREHPEAEVPSTIAFLIGSLAFAFPLTDPERKK